jgi:DNA-binding protein HU-beta
MTVTKTDLVKHLSQELSVTQDNAGKMIQKTLEWIQDSLVSDEDISFLGFGSFIVQKTAAREGRNPQTGAVIQIPEGKRVVFRSGKLLKEALKGQICNVI